MRFKSFVLLYKINKLKENPEKNKEKIEQLERKLKKQLKKDRYK